jgi:hypothetical protein
MTHADRSGSRFDASVLDAAGVRVLAKAESRLMHACALLLRALGNRAFMERYWTTLGRTIYYPSCVTEPLAHPVVLEHELVHVRQWRRWGLWMWFSYLCLPVPVGLAWFRFRWEREAYLVELAHARDRAREIDRIVNTLWYGYAFPWPRRWMRRWFERATGIRKMQQEGGKTGS